MNSSTLTDEDVLQYLRNHGEVLERYVLQEVEPEVLEQWLALRTPGKQRRQDDGGGGSRKTSVSKWRGVQDTKRKMLEDLSRSLERNPSREQVLWELADCITSATDSDGFRLFLIDNPDNPEKLRFYSEPLQSSPTIATSREWPRRKSSAPHLESVANYVVKHKEPIRTSKRHKDERFPHRLLRTQYNNGISDENEEDRENAEDENEIVVDEYYHLLCLPVMQSNRLSAVLELYRTGDQQEFYVDEEKIALSYLVWGGIALHYAQLYNNMDQQRKLNGFLLDVVESIFQDMVSMDVLVTKIMDYAQRLVDADRASLFLVDEKNKDLYSRIFDYGDRTEQGAHNHEEIRFPIGTGIAGIVAKTGEICNIKDAYADPRFNRGVDRQTGYKTNTILCMPVYRNKDSIIGVVQMVNKRIGVFTTQDEEAFRAFAIYCGLALHHAELYDKIRKSEQRYKVAVEVLSYHRSCTEEEFQLAVREPIPPAILGVDDYYFNPLDLQELEQVRHVIFMFTDLFGMQQFDRASLVRFILTVKKNYRRVPYHNWTHGFSVANTMYTIIKRSKSVFGELECLALFIGALCHDLDHRGKNNKFMLDTQSPLASIYSTSTMEHHHFNQTVTILQQDGHNIFNKFTNADFKKILALIKHCILATDLALFMENRSKLECLVARNQFQFEKSEHMTLLQAITMTASDLSASAKPWDVQVKTVEIIFKEFYDQGDAERAAGRVPLPMMDRNRPDEQPASQVGFLLNICAPCYALLHKLVPETKPLLDMVNQNLQRWQERLKNRRENSSSQQLDTLSDQ